MAEDRTKSDPTLALNTKMEEDFVAPLTAVRGALEILRDFPDLGEEERERFLGTALRGCTRLEQAIKELGEAVYAAGDAAHGQTALDAVAEDDRIYAERIKFLYELDAVEIDFSNFKFTSSPIVNHFYDVVERMIEATGRKWYIIVNYQDCSIWPEAWVAFAHRGKKVNVSYSLGTVRYIETAPADDGAHTPAQPDSFDPDMFASRDMALARLEEMKRAASG